MPIPENPTFENIRPVLESLPVPYVPVLQAGVVNKNGRLYTKECLERAAAELMGRVDYGVVPVHEHGRDNVIGVVNGAHFDGERLNVQVRFTDRTWAMVVPYVRMGFTVEGRCAGSGNEIYELEVHSLIGYPLSMEHLI